MKRFILEFLRRGLIACGLGPIILAIVYFSLQQTAEIETISVNKVCLGIFTMTALAFIVGGMNALYQIECLPLVTAILIHGSVLYLSYLATYLINGWLEFGVIPIFVFSAIFVVGFIVIWAIIYLISRKNIDKINEQLNKKRQRQ